MTNHHIKKSILIFLPKVNFNEEEYFTVRTYLEKKGYSIFISSDAASYCVGTSGFKVRNDVQFFNINENSFAAIIIIGGSGIRDYWSNSSLHKIIQKFSTKKRIIAAICAAPVILAKAGILSGIIATCFAENKMELIRLGINFTDKPVVSEGRIITANSSSVSLDFAKAIENGLNQYFTTSMVNGLRKIL